MKVINFYRSMPKILVTVDVNPPRGGDIRGLISKIGDFEVDWVNVTDNSGASVRADSVATAYLLKEATGIDAIPHITCRDTNRMGLQSRLLGAWMLGLDNILTMTGDRVRPEDHEIGVKGIFDVNSIGLIELTQSLNQGVGYNKKKLEDRTSFCIGATVDPNVENPRAEAWQLKKKLEAGAEFILTQPVFSRTALQRFWGTVEELYASSGETFPDLPIFWGVILPRSYEWAERMRSGQIHIPGIEIPDEVVARLKGGDAKEGVRIVREVIEELVEDGIRCFYIIPMGKYEVVPEIIEGIFSASRARGLS
ncbi:MAG: methylenetetrahydrofolate reductase [candidate division NC10 bacterium]|nr:methylenetetrahydrofolate reductase [candidate division NC10 bacterium]